MPGAPSSSEANSTASASAVEYTRLTIIIIPRTKCRPTGRLAAGSTHCGRKNSAVSGSGTSTMMLPARIITGDTSAERIREAAASGSQLLHKPLDTHLLRAANAVSQEVTSTV